MRYIYEISVDRNNDPTSEEDPIGRDDMFPTFYFNVVGKFMLILRM